MLEELIERYQSSSDLELMKIYNNKDGYTDEAKKALDIVIAEKGGIASLQERHQNFIEIKEEKDHLKKEILKLNSEKLNKEEIKNKISCNKLSDKETLEILNQTLQEIEVEEKDVEIKPKTIIGSVLGGIIGGTIGGILWGLQMIYSAHVFYIFAVGLFLISYGTIKLFTKQRKKNLVVFAITIISVIYALILGFYLYDWIGYRGFNKLN